MKKYLLLGTRKGLITYQRRKGEWVFHKQSFLGIPVSYATSDPRSGRWWACLDHGHWGCKLHYSDDFGQNWVELESPKYLDGLEVKEGIPAKLNYIWTLVPGRKKDQLYVGTDPGGLFESNNQGKSFELVRGLWDHPSRMKDWFGGGRDYPGVHSILVNPDNPNHILVGISCAGVFESKDGGKEWKPKNQGLKAHFLPNPDAEVGQDPHLLIAHPLNFNYLWQQNHCGIFRSTDCGNHWEDISEPEGSANFGFAIAVDETDLDTAWVVPAISDVIRTTIHGALLVCQTTDGGKTWHNQTNGLPQEHAFDITYRHALDIAGDTLSFGTTTGNLFISENKGNDWQTVSHHLPMIYSLRFA